MIALSWGLGRNSTWLLVKSIHEGNPPDVVLFLDTGIEHESTYCVERWYVKNVIGPAGIDYVRLTPQTHPQYYDKYVAERTLLQFCRDKQVVPLGAAKWCSSDWKSRPGNAWLPEHGCTENWVGFTAEETRRVIRRGCWMPETEADRVSQSSFDFLAQIPKKYKRPSERGVRPTWVLRAPLWEEDETLQDCLDGLEAHDMLVPDKSGCRICPFHVVEALRGARGGDELAIDTIELMMTLEDSASQKAGRRVGIMATGESVTQLWTLNQPLDGLDIPAIYRPCECAV